tara:strand:- start:1462 stop:1671 length:210 start_codon:yes stop_codon:yes gene_type:complete
MSKVKQLLEEEQAKAPISLEQHLDICYQESLMAAEQSKGTLNEIFEAWGEIFGTKKITKIKSNDEIKSI